LYEDAYREKVEELIEAKVRTDGPQGGVDSLVAARWESGQITLLV